MDRYYIIIENESISKSLQKCAFEMGYKWQTENNDYDIPEYPSALVLFDNYEIRWCSLHYLNNIKDLFDLIPIEKNKKYLQISRKYKLLTIKKS